MFTMLTKRKASKHCHKLGAREWQMEPGKIIEDVAIIIQRGPQSN